MWFRKLMLFNSCIAAFADLVASVGSSSKIQTLCHMTQVLLKLRFTAMERLAGYLKLIFFIYNCAGILLTSIYISPSGC